ncbi:MAG: anti-sigma factor [Mucilaginibacter sp.]|nr:anti-sigma factor [Mucilaginibacter sp.]
MEERDIKNLLDKYRAGIASEEEIALLESWYLHFTAQEPEVLSEEERLQTFNEVWANLQEKPVRRLWPRIAAAASILVGLSVGGYFILHKGPVQQVAQNDVLPGTNHAILKTGNKTIQLDNHANGLLAAQGSTIINKTDSGSIAYQGKSTSEMVYDTLVVPAGAKPYRLTLADGSKLLVNVASKISFPESFSKNERRIDMLSGEAYFEVNHDIARPLRVYVKGQIVKDLGTHFNISAYDDETTTSTTLIQGSLSVSNGNQTKVLIPGQQAIAGQQIKIIKDADLDQIMAWKDGMFKFDSTPLVDIMKQVSRWYDVEVVYQDEALKAKTFFAVSTRFAKVSTLLGNLEKIGGVKFKIDGKKIIVMNP